MNKKASGIRLGIIAMGVLDVLVGLFFMPFLLLWGYVIFIAGCLYLIFGIAVIMKKNFIKLLFYGIIPFTLLHSLILTSISRNQDVSNYHRMTTGILLMWLLPLLFVCIANVIFFIQPRVQAQFR